MDIKLIPAVAALRVEHKSRKDTPNRKFFRISGRIESVRPAGQGENGNTIITISTDEPTARIADIKGLDALLTNG
ncbi:hypothetical protein [Limisalsivibrio acetivorans]|uniref:hypothetical protein n=1 Tax=Limisalsivibrio acetivorans TaxID=1304888 RepID=UPI0003B4C9C9|nr:hypothetical protein [Limisalsivibrio acetivorans]